MGIKGKFGQNMRSYCGKHIHFYIKSYIIIVTNNNLC